jgi:DNA-binding NtrC family response regulator
VTELDLARKEAGMPDAFSILVVEDDSRVRELIRSVLSRAGYRVREAGSAEEGWAEFKASPEIDLAMIDIILPGISGLDLGAELGRRRPETKVVYMSGNGRSVAMESMMHFAPDYVLVKPFSESQLLKSIRKVLGA